MGSNKLRRYWLKKPGNGRRTFALVECRANGKTAHVKDPEISRINTLFLESKVTEPQALHQIEVIRSRYELEAVAPKNPQAVKTNLAIVADYWEHSYAHKEAQLVEPHTMRQDLERTVKAIGSLDLNNASALEIERALSKHQYSPAVYNRRLARLSQLLKYLKRQDVIQRLRRKPEPKKLPTHITEAELSKILAVKTKDREIQVAMAVAFYTGVRLGELVALEPESLINDAILYIQRTQRRDQTYRIPKGTGERTTIIYKPGRPYVKEWLKTPHQLGWKASDWAARAHELCRKAKVTPVSFRELRHSYAIHGAVLGIPEESVAKCMGHSKDVHKKFYAGVIHTDETLDFILRLLDDD